MTLGNLGILAARAADLERGRSLIGEAQALFEETDDAPAQVGMRLNLGNIAAHAGELERTGELLGAGREMAEPQRLFRCVGWSPLTLAEMAIAERAMPSARPGCSTRRWSSCVRLAIVGGGPLLRARSSGR